MSIKIKLFAAIKAAAEVLVGLSAGAAASAGVFALITVIGILPRWAGHTRTARHVSLYEWRNGGESYFFTATIIAWKRNS